ncbi:MAG: hypothetical protein C4560_10945 [Nitrospiraceae bacterium]|nr:MAG: hypothetical protein C4560_10945 [Nitrospiraceae bacterium]
MIYNFFSGMVFSFYGLALMLICSLLVLRYKFRSNTFFLPWILTPVLVPFTYSLLFTPVFIPKYIYFVSLPLCMMASQSLSSMKAEIRSILVPALIILSVATLIAQQNTITKDPWNSVSEYIVMSGKKADKVIIINSYEVLPFSYYFNQDCFYTGDIYGCSFKKGIYPVDSLQEIKKLDVNKFWLIVSREAYNGEIREALKYISDNYIETESREYLPDHPELISRLYNYFEKNDLLHLQFNRIKIAHFQRKRR